MKVVVLVKYVPDSTSERRFAADLTVDRSGSDGVLNELDEHAVEAALTLTEQHGGEVVALTVGPAGATAAVKKALQLGADRAVHVLDDAVHGSDAAATSLVLAAALRHLGDYDVALCGMASTDGGMSVVPAMLAERLGYPQLTFASAVEVDGETVTIHRDGDAATEIVRAHLPVVLSVTDQANEPRYASFKGIMAARKKTIEQWGLADIGVAPDDVGLAGAATRVEAATARPPRTKGTVVTDDGAGGRALVDYLAAERFV